jgi:hypothetical protein
VHPDWLGTLATLVVVFTVAFVALRLIGAGVARAVQKAQVLGFLDRSLGLLIGLARGLVVLGALFLMFNAATPEDLRPTGSPGPALGRWPPPWATCWTNWRRKAWMSRASSNRLSTAPWAKGQVTERRQTGTRRPKPQTPIVRSDPDEPYAKLYHGRALVAAGARSGRRLPAPRCGVFGVYDTPEASGITALGLHALQHRGQEACGMASFDGQRFHTERHMGYVGDAFGGGDLSARLPGRTAIGHTRYSTAGGSFLRNVQPMFADLEAGGIALAHNGNLTNFLTLREQLVQEGAIFQSTSDSEAILHLIARSRRAKFLDASPRPCSSWRAATHWSP